jgi:hypothetical protein
MKKVLLTLMAIICFSATYAQKYGTALCLRLGEQRYGISLRQRVLAGLLVSYSLK